MTDETPQAPGPTAEAITASVEPEAPAPEVPAPAGEYRMKAVWNEIVSKPHEPKAFIKRVPGEIVRLLAHDAERFLRHGLVEPLTDEQKASAAAQAQTPAEKAAAISAPFSGTPVTDLSAN